ncbi:hypothetical protein L249_1134 [Ophiocordyceps polyrhachis-furcata BCC 54312]|uniref:FAM86 N-terminal domain-containing protein n=1 Tax=Ophiocordyceps polyrhachis-furcata BCC 54312 TaxID=1330021 RepID=A0A367LFD8_9HYPO|nr:hypothetical protein L249_1134 [Ophiocordyceps polyrhachis-furcata BCC 54312]
MVHPWMQYVDRFCHQYLQLQPRLDYPPSETLRLAEAQDAIYTRLFDANALPGGPPDRYRGRTLKELVVRIEAAIDDWDEHAVSDHLMAALSMLLGAPLPPEAASAQERCRVQHHLSSLPRGDEMTAWNEPTITLMESPQLISAAGTTGLRTWEAALHLGQYLCLHTDIVVGKRVLELGAGTGYVSILCARHLSCAHVVASDGSDEVVGKLADSFLLNHVDQDPSRISAQKLHWGEASDVDNWPAEVVLGADVIYDLRSVPALVDTIVWAMEASSGVEAYISATQRNEMTLDAFVDACHRRDVNVEQVDFPVLPWAQQRGPFYNDQVVIRIYRLWR